jgi:putative tricarboxylic transport membrane protein
MVRSGASGKHRPLSDSEVIFDHYMRRSNIAAGVILAGLSGSILLEARRLSLGSIRVPQTGFFPAILAVLLLVFSIVLIIQTLRGSEEERTQDHIGADGWRRIGASLATMLGFALVLETLGFVLSTFAVMVLLLRAIEAQKWSRVIAVALITSVASYFLFAWLLSIPLPAGVLGI